MPRRILITLALLATLMAPADGFAAETPAVSFRTVQRACSLRKVAEALARQFKVTIGVDPALADLRVAWAYPADEPVGTILARLAELTDGRVTLSTGASGRRRFTLERPTTAANLETWWRRESLLRSFRELLRAVDQEEQGKLEIESFPAGMRPYLQMGRTSELKYLRLLNPADMDRLILGEQVTLPQAVVSNDRLYDILSKMFASDDEAGADQVQGRIAAGIQAARKDGVSLQIDFNRRFSRIHLALHLGRSTTSILTQFGADELGLPSTRTNPYRLLEAGVGKTDPPALPAAFQERLTENVVTHGGRWEDALRAVAHATRLDLTSDAYLCRYPSSLHLAPGKTMVLAARGVTVAEALDQVCQRFAYLWWQKAGHVYLRAQSWPWDTQYEVPDRFLDRWSETLVRGRPISAAEIALLAFLTPWQISGLNDLSGSQFLGMTNLQQPEVQRFLKSFQTCTLAQRERVMGPGLLIQAPPPAQLAGSLSSVSPEASGPCLWQIEQKVTPNAQASPPATKVELTLVCQRKRDNSDTPQTTMTPLTIEVPQLEEPFERAAP